MINTGILYIVATPIGNLADLTPRAVEVMQQVELLAVEDTRHTQVLLNYAGITTPCQSVHEHNEGKVIPQLLQKLLAGSSIALLSDAGTPLISDPGFQLVREAHANQLKVVPIPGPSAAICALSAAGLATDRFVFEGFLPAKSAARKRQLQQFIEETRTILFFESNHRIIASINDFCEVFGGAREVVFARELTKRFETIRKLALAELQQWLLSDVNQTKGEIVILLAGSEPKSETQQEAERVLLILLETMSVKDAVKLAVKLTGISKKILYELALKLR